MVAAVLMWLDMNMLYVAASTFAYAMVVLPLISLFTKPAEDLTNLVYGRA